MVAELPVFTLLFVVGCVFALPHITEHVSFAEMEVFEPDYGNDLGSGCAPGWYPNGAYCYFFSHDEESWELAKLRCRDMNGYLVEIDSRAENNFLSSIARHLKGDYWIGLSDLDKQGEWRWTTSKRPVTFKNWAKGEPNHLGCEACVEIKEKARYKWNNVNCFQGRKYICKRGAFQ